VRSGVVKRGGAKYKQREVEKRSHKAKKPNRTSPIRNPAGANDLSAAFYHTEQFLSRAYHIMHGREWGNNFLDVFLHNSVNTITDKL